MDKSIVKQAPDYYIDTEGQVFSTLRQKYLKQSQNPAGYYFVRLKVKPAVWATFYVHRLIAEAFIHKPKGKDFVNHIDHNKENNLLANLEWVTASENSIKYRKYINDYKGTAQERINNLLEAGISIESAIYSLT